MLCKLGLADNSHTEISSSGLKLGDVVVVGYTPEEQNKSSFHLRLS